MTPDQCAHEDLLGIPVLRPAVIETTALGAAYLAGLGTGLLGTAVFLWQRRAAQRGTRGAQTGLAIREKRNAP